MRPRTQFVTSYISSQRSQQHLKTPLMTLKSRDKKTKEKTKSSRVLQCNNIQCYSVTVLQYQCNSVTISVLQPFFDFFSGSGGGSEKCRKWQYCTTLCETYKKNIFCGLEIIKNHAPILKRKMNMKILWIFAKFLQTKFRIRIE